MEVVDLADEAGSTAYIIRQVEAAPPGTQWAIGTECNLVQPPASTSTPSRRSLPSRRAELLPHDEQITLDKLARVLEGLAQRRAHQPGHRVPTGRGARMPRMALERMLEAGQ